TEREEGLVDLGHGRAPVDPDQAGIAAGRGEGHRCPLPGGRLLGKDPGGPGRRGPADRDEAPAAAERRSEGPDPDARPRRAEGTRVNLDTVLETAASLPKAKAEALVGTLQTKIHDKCASDGLF